MPSFTFIGAEMWEYSLPKLSLNFGHKFTPQGRLICCIFTTFSAFFKFLVLSLSGDKQLRYKHFPVVGAFSLKFSITPSGETKDRIKKVRGVQKWDTKFYKNRSRGIPLLGKFIPKITNFGDLGAISPHFKVTMVKFGRRVRAWESLPHAKFCRDRLRGYTPLGKIYSKKMPILAILSPVGTHFKSHNCEVWREATDLGHPSRA